MAVGVSRGACLAWTLLCFPASAQSAAPDMSADAAGPAARESKTQEPSKEQAEAARWSLDLGADLTSFLGRGTFVTNSGVRNPYFARLLTLRPMLMPTPKTRLFLFQNISQELTQTDTDTRNARVLLSDTLLGGRFDFATWPLTKTSFNVGLIATLPTSIASRYETLRFSLRPGLGLTQPLSSKVVLLLRTEFSKNFHAYTSPVGDFDLDSGSFLARQGGSELVNSGRVSPGGNNVSYEFWNRAILSYAFAEGWAFNTLLIVVNSFTYESFPLDERSGEGAKAGRGQRDLAYAEINAGYTWQSRYNLSGGIITQGSLTTADGQGIRFPFFDFSSDYRNLTSFFLRFSATLPVLGAPETRTMPNIARRELRSAQDL